jgi:hypothetical protein
VEHNKQFKIGHDLTDLFDGQNLSGFLVKSLVDGAIASLAQLAQNVKNLLCLKTL